MATICFPTRPGRSPRFDALPERAQACRCGHRAVPLERGDTCHRCGRYPREIIDLTWARQARLLGAPPPKLALAA